MDLYLKLKSEVQFQTSEELKMVMKLPDGDETHLAVLITYYPNPAKIFVTNTGIEAVEGSKTLIKKENLFASNLRDDRLEIELTEAPKHGNLRLINFNKEPVLNITRIKGKSILRVVSVAKIFGKKFRKFCFK